MVKCIPRYLIFRGALLKGIVVQYYFSNISLLVYRNATDFRILILYPATLLNLLITSSSFWKHKINGNHLTIKGKEEKRENCQCMRMTWYSMEKTLRTPCKNSLNWSTNSVKQKDIRLTFRNQSHFCILTWSSRRGIQKHSTF